MRRNFSKHIFITAISILFPVIVSLIHRASAVSHHWHIQNLFTFILLLVLAGELICVLFDRLRKTNPAVILRKLFSSFDTAAITWSADWEGSLSDEGSQAGGRQTDSILHGSKSTEALSNNRAVQGAKAAAIVNTRRRGSAGFSARYINCLPVILCALVLLSFFCIHATYKFDRTTDIFGQTKVRSVESGSCMDQVIRDFEPEKLSAVNIKFNTYDRVNEGTVTVELREDGTPVQTWVIRSSMIKDKSYRTFRLDSLHELREGSEYLLHVEEEYEDENDVGLCICGVEGDGYVINGITKDQGTLCYTLTYRNTALKGRFMRIGILLGILAALLILMGINETAMMAFVLAVLFITYTVICPPFMAPDEVNHFRRAYEIAEVGYISEHMGETGVGGNVLPAALNEYTSLYVPEETEEETTKENSEDFASEEDNEVLAEEEADSKEKPVVLINWDETEEVEFGNTALYSPFSYLPQAAGIRIASVFTDNTASIFYAGRISGAIVCFLLCVLAVCTVPFGKRVLFLILTFPLSLQEMISMAPDGFTISLSIFFFAMILKLSYGVSRIRTRDLVVTAVSAIVLSQLKIVYVVLLLLLLMIPAEKFRSPHQAVTFKAVLLGTAFLLNIIWLKISAGFLVEFNPGVDSPAQISFILRHTGKYYGVAASTLLSLGNMWLATMVGYNMGAYTFLTTGIVWVTGLILLIYETLTCHEHKGKVHRWDPLVLIIIFLLGSALVVTSLYVQWTPLQNLLIDGVQGRYFTPLIGLFCFFIIFTRHMKLSKAGVPMGYFEKRTCLYLLVLLYNSITLLDTVQYYISEMW